MARTFSLPTARAFALSGQGSVDPNAPDATLDEVLGTTGSGVVYQSSGHLRGDANARASRAFDDDPNTAWVAPIGEQVGQSITAELDAPVTIGGLDLRVVADGRHSVPTRLRLEVDGRPARTIDLPSIPSPGPESPVATVPVTFEPVTGSTLRLVVDQVAPVVTRDARTNRDRVLPVAIASAGMAGVPAPGAPATLPEVCDDLVTVDGGQVSLRLSGDAEAAADGRVLPLEPCTDQPVPLAAGRHDVRTAPGAVTGIDVDRLVLGSDAGGGALAPGLLGPTDTSSGARVHVTDDGMTHVDAEVTTDGDPFWLVLGQSENKGWELDVEGDASTGPRTLVNGFANGWRITPGGAGELTVSLRWTPQGLVWWAIGISVLALVVCIVLALRRRRPPTGDEGAGGAGDGDERESDAPAFASARRAPGRTPSVGVTVVTAIATGLVAGIAARPWIGLVVGLATAATLRFPRARALLTIGSVVAFAAAATYVVVQQARHGYPTISSWPARFEDVADLAWLAVMLLGADVVVLRVRDRSTADREQRSVASARG